MDVKVIKQIKDDISVLSDLPENNVSELSTMAWQYISTGVNKKIYKSMSQTIGKEPLVIENCVTGISLLLLEAAKLKATEEQLDELSPTLGLPSSVLSTIFHTYKSYQKELEEALRGTELDSAQYKNLQWRLESQLASRSLRGGLEPRVVIKLDLEIRGKPESIALVSDIPNIIHWSQMVEQAIAEGRTHNARRIQRAVL